MQLQDIYANVFSIVHFFVAVNSQSEKKLQQLSSTLFMENNESLVKSMNNHEEYMEIALSQANEAYVKGEFPVGAVFVHKGEVVASGRRAHSQELMASVNEIDHAEIVALRSLLGKKNDIPSEELIVYSTMEPCLMCFSTMILNGIRSFVYAYEDVMGGGTNLPLQQLSPLYAEMKVNITPNVLRSKSLVLFRNFFLNPENLYWKGSLLANYTLSQ